MLSPASWESGVVGLAVEVQASSVVPGYPDEPCFCDISLLSAVSPLDGQEGRHFDSSGFTSAHPEPVSSLLDNNLMCVASQSCFPALLMAFILWVIDMTDPWNCWPLSTPCLYLTQSAAQDHHKPTVEALIFLSDFHPFFLLVASLPLSFGVAGGGTSVANQLVLSLDHLICSSRTCHSSQSTKSQCWDLCKAIKKERSSLV